MAVASPHLKAPVPTTRAALTTRVALTTRAAMMTLAVLTTLVVLTTLAGCASRPAAGSAAPGHAPPAASGPATDPSYDWHGQVLVPFGVLLKSSPVPLHEVLLFHDEAPGAPVQGPVPGAPVPGAPVPGGIDPENKDCYAIDGTPPRLLGQTPDAYLLCFDHDRLNRIESTVHLAPETAAQVFAQACASWLSGAAATVPTAGVCEGRSGTTAFAAHLALEPGEPATLSLVLSNANTVP